LVNNHGYGRKLGFLLFVVVKKGNILVFKTELSHALIYRAKFMEKGSAYKVGG
jgi:hypothetical protein